jgi:hypothetical protein
MSLLLLILGNNTSQIGVCMEAHMLTNSRGRRGCLESNNFSVVIVEEVAWALRNREFITVFATLATLRNNMYQR